MDFEAIKKLAVKAGIGIAISIFILLLNGLHAFNFLYDVGNYLAEPIIYGVGEFSVGIKNIFSTISDIGDLAEDNVYLRDEHNLLKSESSVNKEVRLQNEILKTQLSNKVTKGMTLDLARILGVDRSGVSEHVIIDLGFDDGVETGDSVVIGDILVGDVRDVYKSTSRVRLVTNSSSNIVVLDQDTRAKGLVRGSLDGLIMEEILENEEVNKDDVIIVWADNYPRNLVIGTVSSVQDDPTASTKKAYIQPAVNLENLNYVFVILDE